MDWPRPFAARLLLDPELRILRASPGACRPLGVQPGQLRGTRIEDWIGLSPAVLARLREAVAARRWPWCEVIRLNPAGASALAVTFALCPLRGRRGVHLLVSLRELQPGPFGPPAATHTDPRGTP